VGFTTPNPEPLKQIGWLEVRPTGLLDEPLLASGIQRDHPYRSSLMRSFPSASRSMSIQPVSSSMSIHRRASTLGNL